MSVFNMQEYSGSEDIKKVKNYLYMLNEQLRYMFANMSPEENFCPTALEQYKENERQIKDNLGMIKDAQGNISILERTASSLTSQIQDAQGNISTLQQTATTLTLQIQNAQGDISTLQQTATSLTSQIQNAQGDISTLQQTATSLTSQIQNAQGDISTLQQTATSLTSQIQDAQGNISTLQQTATSLTSKIQNAQGDISKVQQKADRIDWVVDSRSGSSGSFTLTSRMASLVADNIDLTGYVTFNSLKDSGKTTINGDNITTGTIDAKLLEIGGKKVFASKNGRFYVYEDFMNYDVSSFKATNLTAGTLTVSTIQSSGSSVSVGDDMEINGRLTVSNITLRSGGSISGFKVSPSFSGSTLSSYSSITMSGGSTTNLTNTLSSVVGWMNNNIPKIITAVNGPTEWAGKIS